MQIKKWKRQNYQERILRISTDKSLKSAQAHMGTFFTKAILTSIRKVYKVACLKNENKKEDKYWAFKKITYSKDSEGVLIFSSVN